MDLASVLSKALADDKSLLIRVDFASDPVWREIIDAITTPSEDGFLPQLAVVDDSRLSGESPDAIAAAVSSVSGHSFLFIADRVTIANPDHPVLCIELPLAVRYFRVIPSEMWAVDNNLSLANLDFEDFLQAAGPDGIYRGFA